jgi:hypothetical protein
MPQRLYLVAKEMACLRVVPLPLAEKRPGSVDLSGDKKDIRRRNVDDITGHSTIRFFWSNVASQQAIDVSFYSSFL